MALRYTLVRRNPVANIFHATPKNPVEAVFSNTLDLLKLYYIPVTLGFRAINGTLPTKPLPWPMSSPTYPMPEIKKWVLDSDIGYMGNRWAKTIPTLDKQARYARVEMAPPSPAEILKAPGQLAAVYNTWRSGGWKDFTVEQGFANFLVFLEILMWFFIGEIIGRGSIVGYKLTAWDKKVVIDEDGNEKEVNYLRVRFPGERTYNNWGKQLKGIDWSKDNELGFGDLFNGTYAVRKFYNGLCQDSSNVLGCE